MTLPAPRISGALVLSSYWDIVFATIRTLEMCSISNVYFK